MNDDDQTETIRIHTDGTKQTVGIRTDITFEITDNKNSTKNSTEQEDDDEEVPVFKGNGNPVGNRRNLPNQPSFHGINDDPLPYDAGTWVHFFPMQNGWTTERSFQPSRHRSNSHLILILLTVYSCL